MAGFTNETDTIIEGLNEQLSPTINSFILKIQEEPDVLNNLEINKIMKSIIMKMGMRGLLTCAGFRKTMGSSDLHIYPLREDLIMKFNEMNVQLTEGTIYISIYIYIYIRGNGKKEEHTKIKCRWKGTC